MKPIKLAIVGLGTLPGDTLCDLLGDLDTIFPNLKVEPTLFGSHMYAGNKVLCGASTFTVAETSIDKLIACDAVILFGDIIDRPSLVKALATAGVLCVESSTEARTDPRIPLVVPEVNLPEFTKGAMHVANPACLATPLALALAPLHRKFGIKRVIVSTYQSVSGSGRSGFDVLMQESRQFFSSPGSPQLPSSLYQRAIAFNAIPLIDELDGDGHTAEETSTIAEVRKILGLPNLPVAITAVRLPIFVGHSQSVAVEMAESATLADLRNCLTNAPSIQLVDHNVVVHSDKNKSEDSDENEDEDEDKPSFTQFVTPREAHGKNEVFISRVRTCPAFANGASFWLTYDNLRKGLALNALQIVEHYARNLEQKSTRK